MIITNKKKYSKKYLSTSIIRQDILSGSITIERNDNLL